MKKRLALIWLRLIGKKEWESDFSELERIIVRDEMGRLCLMGDLK